MSQAKGGEACQVVEGAWQSPRGFSRNHWMWLRQFVAWQFVDCKNVAVFRSMFRYSEPYSVFGPNEEGKWVWKTRDDAHEILLYGGLWFDLDISPLDKEGWHRLQVEAERLLKALDITFGVGPEAMLLSFSGQKGIHVKVFPEALGALPDPKLHLIMRSLALQIKDAARLTTIDTKVYEARRVMRAMNSLHIKTGLYKIPLSVDELLSWSFDELTEQAKRPRPIVLPKDLSPSPLAMQAIKNARMAMRSRKASAKRSSAPPPLPQGEVPPCIKALQKGPVAKGSRNEAALVIASFLRRQGMKKRDVADWLVSHWNVEPIVGTPLLSEKEIAHAVEMVYRHGYVVGPRKISEITDCYQRGCRICQRTLALRTPV